jgi:hypothetical protein
MEPEGDRLKAKRKMEPEGDRLETKKKKGLVVTEEDSFRTRRILEKFKTTYNGYYLQYLPRSAYLDMELLRRDLNPVQNTLFERFLRLIASRPDRVYTYIEGPFYLAYIKGQAIGLTTYSQKQFYIFGEQHEVMKKREGACGSSSHAISFIPYLKYWLENTPQFLDIYVETNLFSAEKSFQVHDTGFTAKLLIQMFRFLDQSQTMFIDLQPVVKRATMNFTPTCGNSNDDQMLYYIFTTFYNCFEPKLRSSDATCSVARFHAVDVRSSCDNLQTNINDILFGMNLITDYLVIIQPTLSSYAPLINHDLLMYLKPHRMSVFEFFYAMTRNLLSSFVLHKYMDTCVQEGGRSWLEEVVKHNVFLEKELNVPDPVLKSLIFAFLTSKIYERTSLLKIRKKWSKLSQLNNLPKFEKWCQWFYNFIFNIQAFAMDCYCLARVFRVFTPKPNQPPPMQPQVPSTYIIYAGAAHCSIYFEFLMFLNQRGMFHVIDSFTENNATASFTNVMHCVQLPLDKQFLNVSTIG